MNWQSIIVGLIILAAAAYVCRLVFFKVKALTTKKPGCGNDCGCDSSANNKHIAQISPR